MASGDTLAICLPLDNEPPASNYATLGFRNGHPVLNFDTTTQEAAIFTRVMPRNYAGGGITAYVSAAAASATTGTLGWDITFERVTDGSLDTDSDGFATAQTITAATVSGTSGIVQQSNVAITAGAAGTDSVAAGDVFRVRVRRDVANDTATGDGQLYALELKET